MDIAYVVYFIL